jgi:preprotein translocase subunit SecY
MWLGEQITDRGIGNGISLIITIGIVAEYPNSILNTLRAWMAGQFNIFQLILLAAVMLGVIMLVVLMTLGVRKIPVQYAKRVVGRKMYGGQTTHIPLRVNTAGVMPIIFAQSIIAVPGTIAALFPGNELMQTIQTLFSPGGAIYIIIYGFMIIFFAYFYTAIILNPVDLADNMRKYGGFIPGIRPGKNTADYMNRILTRITVVGGLYLAILSLIPEIMIGGIKLQHLPPAALGNWIDANFPRWLLDGLGVTFVFGGTSLLIVVGVAMDTVNQVEAQLIMRHYEGFTPRAGRIRGRRSAV